MLLAAALAMAHLSAQPARGTSLPQLRHIAGVVVDVSGNPIAHAEIVHAGGTIPITDADGKFEVDTSVPAFVVRKPGFRSEFVRINDVNVPRITMQQIKATLVFPTCSASDGLIGIKGFQAQFRFHKVRGVVASRQGAEMDYYVETRQGRKSIAHNSGPLWGSRLPTDGDVWHSQKYDETVYTGGKPDHHRRARRVRERQPLAVAGQIRRNGGLQRCR